MSTHEPIPTVADYAPLKDARQRLQAVEAEAADLEQRAKEAERTCLVLHHEFNVTDNQIFLREAKPEALAKIQDTLTKAQAEHRQALAEFEAQQARLPRLRDLVKGREVEAERVIPAQLRPRLVQAVKHLYASLQAAVQDNVEVRAIQEAARVPRPWGHSSPLSFCEVTAHDVIGRPINALEELVETWCNSPEVKRLLAE